MSDLEEIEATYTTLRSELRRQLNSADPEEAAVAGVVSRFLGGSLRFYLEELMAMEIERALRR